MLDLQHRGVSVDDFAERRGSQVGHVEVGCHARASVPVGGDPTRLRVLPGNKERSDLWERVRRRDAFGMPPLGTCGFCSEDDLRALIAFMTGGAAAEPSAAR